MQLHYQEWGQPGNPMLICLHSLTGHSGRYARMASEHLSKHFHVVAYDLRGHGHSGWEPPWSIERHLEDLLESVPEEARLWVGHSFGGRLVLELAVRHPERIDRGVLLDPAIWLEPRASLKGAEERCVHVTYGSVDDAVDARLATGAVVGAPRKYLREDFAEHLYPAGNGRLKFRYSVAMSITTFSEMSRTPPQETLKVPLLVVRAEQGDSCSAEFLADYQGIVGSKLEATVVPGGHIVMWDALEETAQAIEDYLR